MPNINHKEVGGHKEGAYRGVRQKALDCLYFSFDRVKFILEMKGECFYDDMVGQIVLCRRRFVSEIQDKIGSRYIEENAVVGVFSGHE